MTPCPGSLGLNIIYAQYSPTNIKLISLLVKRLIVLSRRRSVYKPEHSRELTTIYNQNTTLNTTKVVLTNDEKGQYP